MDNPSALYDDLLRTAARRLKGHQRRLFQAEVTRALCNGSPRAAERRFGWGRRNIQTGLHELDSGLRCQEDFARRGRPRTEVAQPKLADDIRALVEPHTQTDPALRSARRYNNLSARELRQQLVQHKGYPAEQLPSERTLRDILNRMGYRLKRIQKGKPLKKPPQTDAIFANVHAVHQQSLNQPDTLEISMDAKAKVNEGEYSRGGKNPDGRRR